MHVNFMIDVLRVTLVLKNKYNLTKELSVLLNHLVTKPTKNLKNQFYAHTFKYFSLFEDDAIIFQLLHGKIQPFRNIDALLVLKRVSIKSMMNIERILNSLKCIKKFNLSYIEFTWDFYPDSSAIESQSSIVRYLYLKSARASFHEGNHPRTTYYINSRKSDAHLKIYIRPKKPQKGINEFVRVELAAKKRWLKNKGLSQPQDFMNLNFKELTKQIRWMRINNDAIKTSILNRLSEGFFMNFIRFSLHIRGISNAIINGRSLKICKEGCQFRGDYEICPLNSAKSQKALGYLNVILSCNHAKRIYNFSSRFCKESRKNKYYTRLMRRAFEEWKQTE